MGSSTDTVSRAIPPHAEEVLGGKVILLHTTGGVVAKLTKAYNAAAENPDFLELMEGRGFKMQSISGDEAEAFLNQWQRQTAWILHDTGIAKNSPEDFDIARPE